MLLTGGLKSGPKGTTAPGPTLLVVRRGPARKKKFEKKMLFVSSRRKKQ